MESNAGVTTFESDITNNEDVHFPKTVSRDDIYAGGVVSIKVPVWAKDGSCPSPEGEIRYFRFSFTVRGGRVYCFVHSNDPSILGQTVRGTVKVMRRTLDNGRHYLYLDIIPVEADTRVTHRLVVRGDVVSRQVGWRVFMLSPPLAGSIVIAPAGTRLPEQARNEELEDEVCQHAPRPKGFRTPTPVREPSSSKSGDGQLDRLLADGWAIDEDYGAEIDLIKYKDGKPKRMTHHRPKQKGGRRK